MNALQLLFTAIANSIRSHKDQQHQQPIAAEDFPDEIAAIQTGTDTSDATAYANQILVNRTAYARGEKLTGTIPQADYLDTIGDSISYSNNVLNFKANLSTPTYIKNYVRVGDRANKIAPVIGLTAEKIKQGEVILGVEGTYAGSGPITQEEYDIDEELARSILEDFTPYTKLEYIQSTGTQCIDTLYYPTQNTKLVMKMETLGMVQGQTVFNAFGTAGTDSRFGWWTYFSGSSYFRYGIESSTRDSKISITGDFTNTLFTVTLDRSVAKIETPTDTFEYSIIPTDDFTLDVSLAIGGHHWNNGASLGQCGAIYKLYYCKIYENNVLVKDYIPVINRLNDKVGVYDKISNTFLYASGTGEYIAGGVANANVTT